MGSLLVIGSTNTDLVIKCDHFPRPGETLLGGDFFASPGGKGANQAVAAARLGARVQFVTKLGRDDYGRRALAGFQREGIGTDYVRYAADAPSGVAVILVDRAGENQIVVASGANDRFAPADLDDLDAAFAAAELVLLQQELPAETVVRAIELAHQRQKRVVLNPAPARELPARLYAKLFAITPNESEAALLTGLELTSPTAIDRAAQELRDRGVANVVITLGRAGSYYSGVAGAFQVPTPQVTATDTTAAGDVFNGALATALLQQREWRPAIEWASRAAAISVTRLGAQESAPYRSELEE